MVLRRQTMPAIEQEYRHIGLRDGLPGLTGHLGQDAFFDNRLKSSGIDDQIG
jgi:hypothetical protein